MDDPEEEPGGEEEASAGEPNLEAAEPDPEVEQEGGPDAQVELVPSEQPCVVRIDPFASRKRGGRRQGCQDRDYCARH